MRSVVRSEYRRRRPEETVLYRMVRDHLATFLDVASRRSGMKDLPAYVRQEFERYLDCGILANGFARVRCPACGHDEAVAFSCKGRGFCPSCMGRRMADTAAHLVDRVFPEVPVRQWVLSFPYGVRLHFARDCSLLSRAITIFMEEVSRHYERELIYVKEGLNGGMALAEVIRRVAARINRLLIRKGLLVEGAREEGGPIVAEPEDPSALDAARAASIREWVGLGPKAKRVEVEGRVKEAPWISPGEKRFAAEEEGYTLHAGVRLEAKDREKLEKVCRYILRPAFAEERIRERGDGKIEYEFRKPRWDGGTKVVLEPLELLEKLAALVPPPRSHLVRYHGVLGPSHEWREAIVPPMPEKAERECRGDRPIEPWEGEDDEDFGRDGRRTRKRRKDQDWATRIRRSLGLDALKCPRCGGRMKVIATIVEPGTVRQILRSMGWSCEIPSRAPPRSWQDEDF